MVVGESVDAVGVMEQDVGVENIILNAGSVQWFRQARPVGLFSRLLEQSGLLFRNKHRVQQQPRISGESLESDECIVWRYPVENEF
jgi:hypothetical protein